LVIVRIYVNDIACILVTVKPYDVDVTIINDVKTERKSKFFDFFIDVCCNAERVKKKIAHWNKQ